MQTIWHQVYIACSGPIQKHDECVSIENMTAHVISNKQLLINVSIACLNIMIMLLFHGLVKSVYTSMDADDNLTNFYKNVKKFKNC